jgi:putative endonuclease
MNFSGALGLKGERAAERYLKRRGYRILARRWRCRHGELDLVASKAGEVVFVEVKTRSGEGFGGPEAAVGPAKSRRLARSAYRYLDQHGLHDVPFRIDVVAVLPDGHGRAELRHYENAVGEPD